MAERSAKTEPRQSAASGPRFWCRQCGKEATELCLDNEHRLCSLQKIRAEQSQPRVDALRRGVASLAALQGLLEESATLRVVLEDCVAWLKRAQDGEADKCKSLETAQDAAVWKNALKAAEPSALSQRAGPLLAALTDPASSCSVALRGGGVAWSGSVDPKDPVARLLLCLMLCAGKLRPEGTPATSTPVDAAAAPRWQERSNQAELFVEEMASKMTKGSRVACGKDGPAGRSEDGAPPELGTVSYEGTACAEKDFQLDYLELAPLQEREKNTALNEQRRERALSYQEQMPMCSSLPTEWEELVMRIESVTQKLRWLASERSASRRTQEGLQQDRARAAAAAQEAAREARLAAEEDGRRALEDAERTWVPAGCGNGH